MNKRLEELAEQARNYALDEKRIYERVHNTEQCMEVYREGYNKKFAELIIKDCTDIVNKRKDAAIEASWNVDEAMSNAVWDIESHFYGVDE
jgi:hypothetical protein